MLAEVRIFKSLFLSLSVLLPIAAVAQDATVSVQVAAVLTQADAESEVKKLQAKGLDAYWVKAQVPSKGTRYRIRLGKFSNESEAQSYAAQACSKNAIGQFVIAQGDSLPARASHCSSAMTATTVQPRPQATAKVQASTAQVVSVQAAPKAQVVKQEPIAPRKEETKKVATPQTAIKSVPVPSQVSPQIASPKPQVTPPQTNNASQTAVKTNPAAPITAPKNYTVPVPARPTKYEPPPSPLAQSGQKPFPLPPTSSPSQPANSAAAHTATNTPAPVTPAPTSENKSEAAAAACRLQSGMNSANGCAPKSSSENAAESLAPPKFTNPNWAVVQASTTANKNLRTVFFFDRLTGWAAGEGGLIYRTDDSGKNWTELPGAVVPNGIVDVHRIYFADPRNGWMLGEMRSREGDESQTVMLSTTDGGQIWQQQVMPGVMSFHFINSKVGWATGRNAGVFKTIDGGLHWKRIDSLTRMVGQPVEASSFNFGFSDIAFTDADHGWAIGNFYGRALTHIGGLFMTSDGGETWRRLPIVIQTKNNATRFTRGLLHSVKFTDVNHGLVAGEIEDGDEMFYFTLRTRDGGQMWEQSRVPSRSIQSTRFLDATYGWTVANASREVPAGAMLYDTVLLRTEDGGKSWEPDYAAQGSHIRSVFFVSPTQGWAVGDNGLIMRYEAKQEKASK